MTRLEQALAVSETASVHLGSWNVSVRRPPRDRPHDGWALTVVDPSASRRSGESTAASQRSVAPTWPVLLSYLAFLGVSPDADWSSGWRIIEEADDLAATVPLPRVP